jgi:ribose transport system permease protein
METRKNRIIRLGLEYNVVIVMLLLIVVSTMLSDVFFTWLNITNLLRQATPLLLVSIGMLVVILTGGIDLSVGSMAALAAVTVSLLLSNTFKDLGYLGTFISIAVALASGMLGGAIMGIWISVFRIAPFVASLAMMTIARGMAYIISRGEPVRFNEDIPSNMVVTAFGSNRIPVIDLPWQVILSIVVTTVFILVSRFTVFGRLIIAIGSNESAVALTGINVKKIKLSAYTITGGLAALAGIMICARSGVGVPTSGNGLELDALAACVIGGASLAGGKGRVSFTVMGALILSLISNIMILMSVPVYPQQVIKGIIIIIAVMLQGIRVKDGPASL